MTEGVCGEEKNLGASLRWKTQLVPYTRALFHSSTCSSCRGSPALGYTGTEDLYHYQMDTFRA